MQLDGRVIIIDTMRRKEVSMAKHGEIAGKILDYLATRPEEEDDRERPLYIMPVGRR